MQIAMVVMELALPPLPREYLEKDKGTPMGLLVWNILTNLMRKELASLKALIVGTASIDYVGKTSVKRTPGDTTEIPHN